MTDYRIGLTGPFPRPEALVRATRDLDRGRISAAEGAAAFAAAEAEVLRLEGSLGFDVRTGGALRWPDLFRPFVEGWRGVEAGALTRFFETNTFYRQPVLRERPGAPGGQLARWGLPPPPGRLFLPGPYSFAGLSEVAYRPAEGGSVVEDLADGLARELASLGADAPAEVEFLEPLLVVRPPPVDRRPAVVRAYARLAGALPGVRSTVWTYLGDAGPVLPLLAQLPVGGVGFDVFETEWDGPVSLGDRTLGLGCLDPTTSLAEDPGELRPRLEAAVGAFRPRTVWLGPNPPFDLLPFGPAAEKLALLPSLRTELGA